MTKHCSLTTIIRFGSLILASCLSLLSSPTNSLFEIKKCLALENSDFEVESPFTDAYGFYNLSDLDNSINDYLANIQCGFSYQDKSILIKAPYLLYSSDENRYYSGSIEDTVEGTTILGPYDTWSLDYNDQPYITTSSDIVVKGYEEGVLIGTISFSLSGNSSSSIDKYYLQNLIINLTSISNSYTSIKIFFSNVHYSSGYHETSNAEDIYETIPYSTYNAIANKSGQTNMTFATVTANFKPRTGFFINGYSLTDTGGNITSYSMTSYDYDAGTVTYRIFVNGTLYPRSYSCRITASCYRPESQKYIKTTVIIKPLSL